MLPLLVSFAVAGTAVLHVAIHREAGAIHDIAADGAAGQCVVLGTTRIACPANGPVHFRWGGGGTWELTGDSTVEPGSTGTAFVLARNGTFEDTLALLEDPSEELVRDVFLRTGANPIAPPSRAMVERLVELASHPDWRIRTMVTRSLMPYVRHTSADPFPPGGPTLVPEGLLIRLATDVDPRVRRRAAHLIRELSREDPRIEERKAAIVEMKVDRNRSVRRLATVLERQVALEGEAEAIEAWNGAVTRIRKPGAPGRAAANSLAVLHGRVEREPRQVQDALSTVLRFHPERGWRVWAAWRQEIPFDAVNAEFLLRETIGLSQPLLRHWATNSPQELAAILERWEPQEPHSERWRVIGAWVDPKAEDPRLRAVLGLPDRMSDPSGGTQTE